MPEIRKILILALDNLGDTVMATGLIAPIRKEFPGAFVGMWVKKYTADIVRNGGNVERLHISDPFWDKSPGLPKGDRDEFFQVLQQVREQNYNLVFVTNADWRKAAACWWARIPSRVGLDRKKSGFFLTTKTAPPASGHFTDDHRRLMETYLKTHLNRKDFVPRLNVSDSEREWAETWLNRKGWSKNPLVVFHPFAGNPDRWWPLNRFVELLQKFSIEFPAARFVLLAGPNEKDAVLKEFAAEPFLTEKGQILKSETLVHIKALLQTAALFVGADSGPGHVAAAVGTPTVSLFGETDPLRCGPQGHNPLIILHKNPISRITVDEALSAARTLFSGHVR